MKTILASLILGSVASAAFAADYSVFRVCEDRHVIRTSDGAEAGRVEYIVVDPSSHRLVSTIVTGGVVGERLVPVPIESITFRGDREVVLTQITRERLVSAPVIERTQINNTVVIQPTIVERSFTHFGVTARASTTTNTRTDVNVNAPTQPPGAPGSTTRTQTREEAERNALRSTTSREDGTTTRDRNARGDRPETERRGRGQAETATPSDRRGASATGERDADRGDRQSRRPSTPEPVAERNQERSNTQPPTGPRKSDQPGTSGRPESATPNSPNARSSEEKREMDRQPGQNRPSTPGAAERGAASENRPAESKESGTAGERKTSSSSEKASEKKPNDSNRQGSEKREENKRKPEQ